MWRFYNPNPQGKLTRDCVVRAMAAALNLSWDEAYALIAAKGFIMCDMPNANSVWGAELKANGFERGVIPNTCPDCYTFADFANDHMSGTFVLGTGTHVATVKDGMIYDSWDSSMQVPQYYFWRD